MIDWDYNSIIWLIVSLFCFIGAFEIMQKLIQGIDTNSTINKAHNIAALILLISAGILPILIFVGYNSNRDPFIGLFTIIVVSSFIIVFTLSKILYKNGKVEYELDEAVTVTYKSLSPNLQSSLTEDDVEFILDLYPINLPKFKLSGGESGEPIKIDWPRLKFFIVSEARKKGKKLTVEDVDQVLNAEEVYLKQIGLLSDQPDKNQHSD